MHVSWYWILGNLNVRVRHCHGDTLAVVMIYKRGELRLDFTTDEKLIVRLAYMGQQPTEYSRAGVARTILHNVPRKLARRIRRLVRT